MSQPKARAYVAIAVVAAVVAIAVAIGWRESGDQAATWRADTEGFLAVAVPCCERASLWDALDAVTPDEQRARPASAAEVAEWLNTWPYRSREDVGDAEGAPLQISAQSTEVRCTGPVTGPEIPRDGNDTETVEALRNRRECTFAKWKIWSGQTAAERPNERHTVWVDDAGAFRGRVDYWR